MKEKTNKFGHTFKKSLGQNFLSDSNLLTSIAKLGGADLSTKVVEVGAGAGALTEKLAINSKQVLSFEVDRSLEEILLGLQEKHDNLKVVFKDIMEVSLDEIHDQLNLQENEKYKLIANIPYYITTPIILKFLFDKRIESISVMVQKEVAERISSGSGAGDYGSISALVGAVGKAKIEKIVGKHNFYPVPKVDSALLKITLNSDRDYSLDEPIKKLLRESFKARRKTLINNLSSAYDFNKEELGKIIESVTGNPNSRPEELSSEQYLSLLKLLKK